METESISTAISLDITPALIKAVPEIQSLESQFKCQICYEVFTDPVMTNCSHNFCSICLRKYLIYKTQCPQCYEDVYERELKPNKSMKEVILICVTLFSKLSNMCKSQNFKSPEDSQWNTSYKSKSVKQSKDSKTTSKSSIALKELQSSQRPILESSNASKSVSFSTQNVKSESFDDIEVLPSSQESILSKEISNRNRENSPIEDVSENDSGIDSVSNKVPCPVCNVLIPQNNINLHLDKCLADQSNPALKPKPTKTKLKPIQKLVYHLLKDADLRKKCKDEGLETKGERKALIFRHQRFSILWNDNCQKEQPQSRMQIVMQVQKEEQQELKSGGLGAGGKTKERGETAVSPSTSLLQYDRKTDEKVIDEKRKEYMKRHKSDFQKLIEETKLKMKKKREEAEAKKKEAEKEEANKQESEEGNANKNQSENDANENELAGEIPTDNLENIEEYTSESEAVARSDSETRSNVLETSSEKEIFFKKGNFSRKENIHDISSDSDDDNLVPASQKIEEVESEETNDASVASDESESLLDENCIENEITVVQKPSEKNDETLVDENNDDSLDENIVENDVTVTDELNDTNESTQDLFGAYIKSPIRNNKDIKFGLATPKISKSIISSVNSSTPKGRKSESAIELKSKSAVENGVLYVTPKRKSASQLISNSTSKKMRQDSVSKLFDKDRNPSSAKKATSSNKTLCPSCEQEIPMKHINLHLDRCLEKVATRKNDLKNLLDIGDEDDSDFVMPSSQVVNKSNEENINSENCVTMTKPVKSRNSSSRRIVDSDSEEDEFKRSSSRVLKSSQAMLKKNCSQIMKKSSQVDSASGDVIVTTTIVESRREQPKGEKSKANVMSSSQVRVERPKRNARRQKN